MRSFIIIFFITLYGYAEIGYISAMRGDVYLERDGVESRAFKGLKLESKDAIKTDKRSKAQLIFNDKSVIRVGRDTEFKIEKYLFDKTKESKAEFKVNSGFFSAFTGEIGKISQNRFKLHTRTSTIGIRGTHFQGLIEDGSEDIACLKGAIFVEIGGESIDVLAGEILNIKAGVPSIPREFKTVDIDSMEEKDSLENEINSIDTQISDLSKIKDTDVKYAQYSVVMERLSELESDVLSENYTKTPTILQTSSGDTRLSIYTNKDVVIDESDTLAEKLQKIEDGEAVQVGFDKSSTEIALDTTTENYWNGDSEGGKILKYSGNIIFVGDLDPNTPETVITQNGVNPIEVTLDTQNRFVTGEFNYLNSPIIFSNSGGGAVQSNHFMFYSNNILESGNKEFILSQVQNGYSGDDIYSYISFVDRGYFETGETTSLNVGGFIAEKVEEIDITKKDISSDDIFSWGYWAYQDGDIEKIRGGWLSSSLDITPTDKIDEYREQSAKATYSGEVFGTVENSLTGLEAEEIQNGSFQAEIDFSANRVNGNIEFSSENTAYRQIGFEAQDIIGDDDSLTFHKTASNVASGDFIITNGDTPSYMYGSGQLYGDDAQYIGGGFNAGFENGDTAIAGFKGSKE